MTNLKQVYNNYIKINFIIIFLRSLRGAFLALKNLKNKGEHLKIFDRISFLIIRSFYSLSYFRNKIGHKKTRDIEESLFFNKLLNKNKLVNSLIENGHSDTFILKKDLQDKLLNEILINLKNSIIITKENSILNDEIEFSKKDDVYQYLINNNVHIIKSNINLKSSNILKKIFVNDFFINLAKDYLNTDKLTIAPQFHISSNTDQKDEFNKINKLKSSAAQEYHFDVDFKKFFKIFVYFSDVLEIDQGAHIFVPTTHRKKQIENILPSRFKTSDIHKIYGSTKTFLGEAGTVFMVDTFGIHKGSPIKKGVRMALILEFGKDHFPFNTNCEYV